MTKLKSKEFTKVVNPTYDEKFNYTVFKPLTRVLNALSLTFPVGEKWFCTAIRDHKNLVDSDLQLEIQEFIRQEAQHSMAHRSLNQSFGLDLSETDATATARLAKLGTTAHERLMTTKALETLTAFGGYLYLKGAKYLFKKNQVSKIWADHAKEEVDHEFVAEAVYNCIYVGNKREYLLHFYKTCVELICEVTVNYRKLKQIEKESKK